MVSMSALHLVSGMEHKKELAAILNNAALKGQLTQITMHLSTYFLWYPCLGFICPDFEISVSTPAQ